MTLGPNLKPFMKINFKMFREANVKKKNDKSLDHILPVNFQYIKFRMSLAN